MAAFAKNKNTLISKNQKKKALEFQVTFCKDSRHKNHITETNKQKTEDSRHKKTEDSKVQKSYN